jgi:8-oxo-dGTP pyrophosphatase MutT (NUDIX family)
VTSGLGLGGQNPWRTLSSSVVYDNGQLRFREDDIVQPDGNRGKYAYLEVPLPVVGVVALDDEERVYLVRQWRYPWQRNSWEIPTGGAEAGEAPLASAQRELAEEVGVCATSWEPLWTGYSSATVNARWHVFLARGLEPVEAGLYRRDGAEHDMIVRRVPLADAIEAAMDGRIEHGMSVMALLRVARRLGI